MSHAGYSVKIGRTGYMHSRIAVLLFALASSFAAAVLPCAAEDHVKPFYAVTAEELAGPPGSIIRIEPWDLHTAYWVRAFRILYRSTGLEGEPIAVSGAVIIPQFPARRARVAG